VKSVELRGIIGMITPHSIDNLLRQLVRLSPKDFGAEGEAKAIENVSKAADQFFVGNAHLLKQLQVTQASLEDNTKLVISDQSRLINVLGLAEALAGTKPRPKTQTE